MPILNETAFALDTSLSSPGDSVGFLRATYTRLALPAYVEIDEVGYLASRSGSRPGRPKKRVVRPRDWCIVC